MTVVNGLNGVRRNITPCSYDKGRHSFVIIEKIDPKKVTDASPYAKRFVETLVELAGKGASDDKDTSSAKQVDRSHR